MQLAPGPWAGVLWSSSYISTEVHARQLCSQQVIAAPRLGGYVDSSYQAVRVGGRAAVSLGPGLDWGKAERVGRHR